MKSNLQRSTCPQDEQDEPAKEVSAAKLLSWGESELTAHGMAPIEAKWLLQWVLEAPSLLAVPQTLEPGVAEKYQTAIKQRSARVPLQHVMGEMYFRSLKLVAGPGVFCCRPETELIPDLAKPFLQKTSGEVLIADLCAGSGAIGLALATENPNCWVYLVEISEQAVPYTRRNIVSCAPHFARGSRVQLVHGDALTALPELAGKIDLVVCNPPYVRARPLQVEALADPDVALYGGGEDGLVIPRGMANRSFELLNAGGLFIMELAEEQCEFMREFMLQLGFATARVETDLTGRKRFVVASKMEQVEWDIAGNTHLDLIRQEGKTSSKLSFEDTKIFSNEHSIELINTVDKVSFYSTYFCENINISNTYSTESFLKSADYTSFALNQDDDVLPTCKNSSVSALSNSSSPPSVVLRYEDLLHSADQIRHAIQSDQLVVVPTDTVYGIGANPFSALAVSRLLRAKGRDESMPPPVLVASAKEALALADIGPDDPKLALIEKAIHFWPGSVTIILPAKPGLGWESAKHRGTVAVRVPDERTCLAILEITGPLAVTSANLTGKPPAQNVSEAKQYFGSQVAIYFDGGQTKIGESSTIVDLTQSVPELLRPGPVTLEQLFGSALGGSTS